MKLINIAARVTTTRTWHTHTACLVRPRLGFVLLPSPTFLCLSLVIKFMHRRRMPRVLRKLHSSLQFAVCSLLFVVRRLPFGKAVGLSLHCPKPKQNWSPSLSPFPFDVFQFRVDIVLICVHKYKLMDMPQFGQVGHSIVHYFERQLIYSDVVGRSIK